MSQQSSLPLGAGEALPPKRHIWKKNERARIKQSGQVGIVLLVSVAGCWVGNSAHSTRPLLYYFHEIEPVSEPLGLFREGAING